MSIGTNTCTDFKTKKALEKESTISLLGKVSWPFKIQRQKWDGTPEKWKVQ